MIPAELYHSVFLYVVIALTLLKANEFSGKNYDGIRDGSRSWRFAFILSLVFALWLGARPISSMYFGDTGNYARIFNSFKANRNIPIDYDDGEWLWDRLMLLCADYGDVSLFFTVVDIGYFGFTLWACRRLTPNNVMASLLFAMGALSFYSYGMNGIRNGLACSMILLALTYATGNLGNKILAAVIAFAAYNIHHSTALPILMAVLSLYCIKSFRWAYVFWILSILISLVAGDIISSFFAGLGFDDRLSYITAKQDAGMFSGNGFRWDFLIYSMMPIILGYYLVMKKGIKDNRYMFLLNTYTLANAFWVMVIRANYSNRFAYLSWFMYPFVLAYPLLRFDIWGEQQGIKTAKIMLAHIGFTWFMQTFYW